MYPPLWTRLLRAYGRYFPINRGKSCVAKWAYAGLPTLKEPFTAPVAGRVKVELHPWLWVDFCTYVLGSPESYHVAYVVSRLDLDSVVFDVGAYIGVYGLNASQVASDGKVYAFEPDPRSAERLQRAVESSNTANVEIVQCALSDLPGTSRLALNEYPPQSSIETGPMVDNTEEQVSVRQDTVDRYCTTHKISHIDFLKIDVEGAELLVLRGARSAIGESHPEMLIELHRTMSPRFGYSTEDVISYLLALGYRLYEVVPGLRRPRVVPFEDKGDRGTSRLLVVARWAP